jgi:hypothetical protein
MARTTNACIALLISLVMILAVASSPSFSALAGTKEPPPPKPAKPAKPKGPTSTFNFNQYGPSNSDDVVLRWDEQTLAAVRVAKPPPTVVARHLAIVHTAMYDA